MLYPHYAQQQSANVFIGSNAKIKQASLQKSFIENEANEKSLMQIVQSKASRTDQKNLALYKTLQKSLVHQNFKLFNQAFVLLPQDTPKKTATLLRLGSALMYKIHDTILTHDSPSKNEIKMSRQEIFFGKFIALLTQYHTQERSVTFYAEKLCITPKYFSTLIKKQTGKSAAQWIDDYVILEAKNLLKFSGMSIQEIAYHLNFSTQSFFGKYFKHQTGLSPSEYRSSE
jgi:AraC-like DNA-binding protein